MLNSRVASLINEGDELKNTIRSKDSEISQKKCLDRPILEMLNNPNRIKFVIQGNRIVVIRD